MKKSILIIFGLLAMNFVHSQELNVKQNEYTAVGEFFSNYAWVNIGGKTKFQQCPEGGKWGVIDMHGKEVCPVKYDYVDLCSNDKVAVNIGGKMKNMKIEGGKWGFVDLITGQEIIPVQYDQVGAFTDRGTVWVCNGGNNSRKVWAQIIKNEKGKVDYMERYFDVYDDFSMHYLFDKEDDTFHWSLIDSSGQEIVGSKFSKVGHFHHNVAWCVQNGKYGMIDYTGKVCIPFQYAKLSDCTENGVVLAWEIDNGASSKVGLLSKNGEKLTEMKYTEINAFTDGVAWGKVNGLYGLIDYNGKELTQPRYSKVGEFYNGVALVWSEMDALGCVNKSGKEIARTIYAEAALKFGVCQFRTDKNEGKEIISWISHPQLGNSWINQNGKVIARGTKVSFKITDVIPESLWDF